MAGRVLVTGSSSFTGPYITRALTEQGYEVFGLGHGRGSDDDAVTECAGNLLDPDSLRKVVDKARPEYVIHLAAITFVPHGDIAAMYLTNVVGTRNLLQVLAEAPEQPRKVVIASSANVYGNSREGLFPEETPFAPANDYAASKVAMEYMAAIWSAKLPIAFTRPFNYTGVGQAEKFLIPKIVSHFQQKKTEIELGNIDVVRDFSDVRFVASAYATLLERAEVGQVYNICSGIGYSLKALISRMNELAGYEIDVRVNPDFVRANEVKRLVGDNSKLLALDSSLKPIDIGDTLSWMFSAPPGS